MFNIGNVVRLKNGTGPDMTIDYVEGADDEMIGVIWFNANSDLLAAEFRTELLELVRE